MSFKKIVLGVRVLHMVEPDCGEETHTEWAIGNTRLIFKVRCLDKDNLLLHR